MKNRIAALCLALALFASGVHAAEWRPAFFAFDNGVGRGSWTPAQQAQTLKELGYAGIGYSGTDDLAARLKAFEEQRLKVFSIYVACFADREEAFAPELAAAIKALKGTDVVIWLTVQGKAGNDPRAAEAVRQVADLAAASDLKVVLYPHHGFVVATLEDALRIRNRVDRNNLGVSFNLCHELRAGNEPRFEALLEEAMPYLDLISINGADQEGGWDKLIQPLDRGEFDVYGLLKTLKALGYGGPIGLQCYQVPGDIRENLARSMAQWQVFQKRLRAETE